MLFQPITLTLRYVFVITFYWNSKDLKRSIYIGMFVCSDYLREYACFTVNQFCSQSLLLLFLMSIYFVERVTEEQKYFPLSVNVLSTTINFVIAVQNPTLKKLFNLLYLELYYY